MTSLAPTAAVLPTNEARSSLTKILSRFRRDGAASEPIVFGSHRRPEGVVIPYELYREAYPSIIEAREAALIRSRISDGKPRVTLEHVIDSLGFSSTDFDLG
jgi:hypothetical protein